MEPSSVKNIVISGGAMADFGKRRGTTRKTRAPQTGGFDAAPGPAIALGAMNISKIGSFRKNIGGAFQSGGATATAPAPAQAPSTTPAPQTSAGSPGSVGAVSLPRVIAGPAAPAAPAAPASAAPGQLGGAKKKSLVLAPPKKQTRKSKVHLAPPASKDKKPAKSLKTTRKIRVHLGGLKKRLCRAKTIKHDSRKKPISEIRRTLEEAKLVKPCTTGKEVPEDVLRTIFHDYMLLRNRVL
jgi:hypothetical protein